MKTKIATVIIGAVLLFPNLPVHAAQKELLKFTVGYTPIAGA